MSHHLLVTAVVDVSAVARRLNENAELVSGRAFKSKITGLVEESFYVENKANMLFLVDSVGAVNRYVPPRFSGESCVASFFGLGMEGARGG